MHLSAAHPATVEAFLRFVDDAVDGRTDRFFVLGDLFEYWAGDEDLDDPIARCVAERLRALSASGTAVAFMAGNRDFLIGDAFAEAAALRRLPDPWSERIGTTELLLSHGDALCVDDVDYQRFRTMVREPAWRSDFLAKPYAERRALVAGAREQSEAAKKDKAGAIMDANAGAVDALLGAHPGTILIHGHTHRPARHVHGVRERWVLPDWDLDAEPPRGGGLGLREGSMVELPIDVGRSRPDG